MRRSTSYLLPRTYYLLPTTSGGILIMTLVFVVMFAVIFTAIAGLVNRTYHESVLQAQDETAFQIAEAGLNYARWRLAHDPDNFSTETKTVTDQLAGDIGSYAVEFTPPAFGSTVVLITATGTTTDQLDRSVVLRARYGRSSLARFAAITNEDVWYGGIMSGAVHANGGIRMDGTSDSLMTSAQETYTCQTHHGCSNEAKPGVWGSGQKAELWQYPVAPVDYNSLSSDLVSMKTAAQNANNYYGPSGMFGYQIVFNVDNTYTISKVKTKGPNVWSWWSTTNWQNTSHDVGTTELVATKPVPSGGIIFVADTLWINGTVVDRVTVAAGVFPDTPAANVDIIVNGNITYGGVHDGTRTLGAIAQRHILIPWSGAPATMTMEGAFIAQKGSFHRRYYANCCGTQAHYLKTSLTRYGMVASNGVPATSWVSGSTITSGFQSGTSAYDSHLLYGPPPYFPVNGQYEFISWEEQQ